MLTHCGTNPIQTKRLILRPFTLEDSQTVLHNWAGDPQVQKQYLEPVYETLDEVRELLKKYTNGYQYNDYYRWAVVEHHSQQCIGQIAFFLVDSQNHFAEIEYCIGRAYQRNGYCSEAVKAVVQYGFEQVHFHKIQVCHIEDNLASQGVIQSCGFQHEGILRDYFFIDAGYRSRFYYSMLYSEWKKKYG